MATCLEGTVGGCDDGVLDGFFEGCDDFLRDESSEGCDDDSSSCVDGCVDGGMPPLCG